MTMPGFPAERNDESPPRPIVHPLLALAVSVLLAAATGLLVDWTAAVTVFVTTVGLLGVQKAHSRRLPRGER
ncbi:hypothetical protein [Nocardia sp. CA-119907]|uniref:hypothetical protein n=1 Tax=Nocardia sp. CA-119907 TaxID=3239973 RepID=UPI003D951320